MSDEPELSGYRSPFVLQNDDGGAGKGNDITFCFVRWVWRGMYGENSLSISKPDGRSYAKPSWLLDLMSTSEKMLDPVCGCLLWNRRKLIRFRVIMGCKTTQCFPPANRKVKFKLSLRSTVSRKVTHERPTALYTGLINVKWISIDFG